MSVYDIHFENCIETCVSITDDLEIACAERADHSNVVVMVIPPPFLTVFPARDGRAANILQKIPSHIRAGAAFGICMGGKIKILLFTNARRFFVGDAGTVCD